MPDPSGDILLDAQHRNLDACTFPGHGDKHTRITRMKGRIAQGHLPENPSAETLLLAKIVDDRTKDKSRRLAAHARTACASASISCRLPKQKGVRW